MGGIESRKGRTVHHGRERTVIINRGMVLAALSHDKQKRVIRIFGGEDPLKWHSL